MTALNVIGRVRLTATLGWIGVGMLTPALVIAAWLWGVKGVAAAHMLVTLAFVILLFAVARVPIGVSAIEIVQRIWRPIVAAAVMALAVKGLHATWIAAAPLRLLHDVVLGAVVFSSALMLLWWLAGRPAGVERWAAEVARRALARLAGHSAG
jgi:PST family polysaccharide transporter